MRLVYVMTISRIVLDALLEVCDTLPGRVPSTAVVPVLLAEVRNPRAVQNREKPGAIDSVITSSCNTVYSIISSIGVYEKDYWNELENWKSKVYLSEYGPVLRADGGIGSPLYIKLL